MTHRLIMSQPNICIFVARTTNFTFIPQITILVTSKQALLIFCRCTHSSCGFWILAREKIVGHSHFISRPPPTRLASSSFLFAFSFFLLLSALWLWLPMQPVSSLQTIDQASAGSSLAGKVFCILNGAER
jgi:hypothetical protein